MDELSYVERWGRDKVNMMTAMLQPWTLERYLRGPCFCRLKGHSHCAPYGAAKQLLSALHRRRTDFAAVIAPVSISLFDAALRAV